MSDHYKAVERQGIEVEANKLPKYPKGYDYIWSWWSDLNQQRQSGGFGPAVFRLKDMIDYLRMFGSQPDMLELRLLQAIEREFIKAHNGRHSQT